MSVFNTITDLSFWSTGTKTSFTLVIVGITLSDLLSAITRFTATSASLFGNSSRCFISSLTFTSSPPVYIFQQKRTIFLLYSQLIYNIKTIRPKVLKNTLYIMHELSLIPLTNQNFVRQNVRHDFMKRPQEPYLLPV